MPGCICQWQKRFQPPLYGPYAPSQQLNEDQRTAAYDSGFQSGLNFRVVSPLAAAASMEHLRLFSYSSPAISPLSSLEGTNQKSISHEVANRSPFEGISSPPSIFEPMQTHGACGTSVSSGKFGTPSGVSPARSTFNHSSSEPKRSLDTGSPRPKKSKPGPKPRMEYVSRESGASYSRWRHHKQKAAESAMENLLSELNQFDKPSKRKVMGICGEYWRNYAENYHLIEESTIREEKKEEGITWRQ